MKKVVYIGRFTPTSGGVTAKNSAIYNELKKQIEIKKLDLTQLKKGKISMLFSMLFAFLNKKNILIIGTTAKTRRIMTQFLYFFNRKAMRSSVLVVMGGAFAKNIAADSSYQKWLKEYKAVYVETESMKAQLEAFGLSNASIFPNCRKRPQAEISVRPRSGALRCVCFSMLYPEKGIDTALLAARMLPNVEFDFWGAIDGGYKGQFMSAVEKLPNCKYNGVYKVSGDNVYGMLNEYDLLLFPTRMDCEGVPGTLVEAKIAALPAVVSNVAFNAELVEHEVSGLVLEENSPKALAQAVDCLNKDGEKLLALKHGTLKSADNFYFDKYINEMVSLLK